MTSQYQLGPRQGAPPPPPSYSVARQQQSNLLGCSRRLGASNPELGGPPGSPAQMRVRNETILRNLKAESDLLNSSLFNEMNRRRKPLVAEKKERSAVDLLKGLGPPQPVKATPRDHDDYRLRDGELRRFDSGTFDQSSSDEDIFVCMALPGKKTKERLETTQSLPTSPGPYSAETTRHPAAGHQMETDSLHHLDSLQELRMLNRRMKQENDVLQRHVEGEMRRVEDIESQLHEAIKQENVANLQVRKLEDAIREQAREHDRELERLDADRKRERNNLEAKIEELKDELKRISQHNHIKEHEVQSQSMKKDDEIKALKKEVIDARMKTRTENEQELRQASQSYSDDIQRLRERNTLLLKENAGLKEEATIHIHRLNSLEAEVDSLAKQLRMDKDSVQSQKKKEKSLVEQVQSSEARSIAATKQLMDQKNEVESLRISNSKLKNRISDLESALDDLTRERNKLQTDYQSVVKTNEQERIRCQLGYDHVAKLKRDLQSANYQMANIEEKIRLEYEKSFTEREREISVIRHKHLNCDATIRELKNNIEHVAKEKTTALRELDKLRSQMTSEQLDYDREIEELKYDKIHLDSEVRKLTSQIKDYKEVIKQLQVENRSLIEQQTKVYTELKHGKADCINILKKQNEMYFQETEKLMKENLLLHESVKSSSSKERKYKSELKRRKNELKVAIQQRDQFKHYCGEFGHWLKYGPLWNEGKIQHTCHSDSCKACMLVVGNSLKPNLADLQSWKSDNSSETEASPNPVYSKHYDYLDLDGSEHEKVSIQDPSNRRHMRTYEMFDHKPTTDTVDSNIYKDYASALNDNDPGDEYTGLHRSDTTVKYSHQRGDISKENSVVKEPCESTAKLIDINHGGRSSKSSDSNDSMVYESGFYSKAQDGTQTLATGSIHTDVDQNTIKDLQESLASAQRDAALLNQTINQLEEEKANLASELASLQAKHKKEDRPLAFVHEKVEGNGEWKDLDESQDSDASNNERYIQKIEELETEVKGHKEKIEHKDDEIQRISQISDKYHEDIQHLKEELESLQANDSQRTENFQQEINHLKQTINELRSANEILIQENNIDACKHEDLEEQTTEYESLKIENEKLHMDKDELQRKLHKQEEKYKKDMNLKKENRKQLMSKINKRDEEIASLKQEIDNLNEKVEMMKLEASHMETASIKSEENEEIENLKKDKEILESKIQILSEQASTEKNKQMQLNNEIETLQEKLDELQKQKELIKNELESKSSDMIEKEVYINQLEQEKTAITAEKVDIKSDLDALYNEYDDLQKKLYEKEQGYKTEISKLEAEYKTLNEKFKDENELRLEVESEYGSYKEEMEGKLQTVEDYNELVQQFEELKTIHETVVSDKESEMSDNIQKLQAANDKITELDSQNEVLKTEIDKIKDAYINIDEYESVKKELVGKTTEHEAFVEQSNADIDQLQKELSEKDIETEQLLEKVSSLESVNQTKDNALDEFKEKLAQLENSKRITEEMYQTQIDQKDTEISDLKEEKNNSEMKIIQLLEEIKTLTSKVTDEKDELVAKINEQKEIIMSLRENITTHEITMNEFKEERYNFIDSQKHKLQDETEHLTQETSRLIKELEDCEAKYTTTLSEKEEEISNLSETVQSLNETVRNLKEQSERHSEEYQQSIDDMTSRYEAIEEKYTLIIKQYSELEHEHSNMITENEESLDKMRQYTESQQETIEEFERNLLDTRSVNDRLQDKLAELQSNDSDKDTELVEKMNMLERNTTKLKDENETLKSTLDEMEDENTRLVSQIESLEIKNNGLNHNMDEMEEEQSQLNEQLQRLQTEYSELLLKFDEIKDEKEDLETRQLSLDQRLQILQDESFDIQTKHDDIAKEKEILEDKQAQLNERLEKLQKSYNELNVEHEQVIRQNSNIKTEFELRIKDLHTEYSTLQSKYEELNADKKQSTEAYVQELSDRLQTLQDANDELKKKHEELANDKHSTEEDLHDSLRKMQDEYSDLQARYDALWNEKENQESDYHEKMHILEESYSELKVQYDQLIIEKQTIEARLVLLGTSGDRAEKNNDGTCYNSEHVELLEKINSLKVEIQQLSTKTNHSESPALEAEEKLRDEVAIWIQRYEGSMEGHRSLRKEYRAMESKLQTITKQIQQLKDCKKEGQPAGSEDIELSLAQKENETKEHEAQIADLQQQIAMHSKETKDLKESISVLLGENSQLEKQVSELQKDFQQLEQNSESLKTKNKELATKIQELYQRQATEVKLLRANHQTEIDIMQNKVQMYEASLEQQKQELERLREANAGETSDPRLQEIEEENDRLRARLTQLDQVIVGLKSDVKSLREEQAITKAMSADDIRELQTKYQTETQEKDMMIIDMQEEITSLEAEKSELERNLRSVVEELEAKLENKEAQMKKLAEEHQELAGDNHDLRSSIKSVSSKVQILEEENGSLKQQIEELKEETHERIVDEGHGLKNDQASKVKQIIGDQLQQNTKEMVLSHAVDEQVWSLLGELSERARVTIRQSDVSNTHAQQQVVMVPSVAVSRLGSDVEAAMATANLADNQQAVLLILHPIAPHNALTMPSANKLHYEDIVSHFLAVIDVLFWNNEIYDCDTNTSAIQQLRQSVKT